MDAPSQDVLLRPMRAEDVDEAERLSGEAFWRLALSRRAPGDPEPRPREGTRSVAWRERTAHLLRTDPAGCWVAETTGPAKTGPATTGPTNGTMVGFATSFRRDLTWILATFTVRPGLQAGGVGRQLLAAALGHSRGCLRGMLSASDDPRAFRLYRQAGFSLHPQLVLRGVVDRSALPVVEHVREGTAGDVELMDSIDRRVRDAAHGVDHAVLARLYRLLVLDRGTGSGYVYLDERGQPALLAATNRRTATRLLWEALAATPPGERVEVSHVTAVNEWAVDVGLAARLSVSTAGYLALRGMKPPLPYVHHGSLL